VFEVADHGLEDDPSFSGVRVSFFLSTLTRFAKKYEPARQALEQRRDALEASILKGNVDFTPVSDMVHLNRALGTRERSLAVLDKVPADKWVGEAIAHQVLVRDALEDDDTASRLAERLLEMEPGATTWLMILGAAKRAGNQMACHDYAVRALAALPEDDHGRVRGFLKRR